MDLNGLYKSADGAALRFFEQADKNTFASERNGRPIYDQVLFVEVITPGSRESSPVFELERVFNEDAQPLGADQRPVERLRTPHFERFKPQVAAFRGDTDDAELRGTPLSAWPAIDSATAASLAEGRVYTVEALAQLPDEKLRILGPQGRTLRERAQVFLNAAAGNAQVEGMAADLQDMRDEMARMREELAAANARAERAEETARTAPGQQVGNIQPSGDQGGNGDDQGGDKGGSGGNDQGGNGQRTQGKAADAEKGNGASGEGRETGNDTARAPNSRQRRSVDPATAGAVNNAETPPAPLQSSPAPAGTSQTPANPQGGNALPPII